jgi:hypothetical protein
MCAPKTRLRKSPQVAYQDLHDGGVLLHLESGQYHGLNEMGCLIWDLVDGERTLGDLVAELRIRLEDAPPGLEADIADFVRDLRARRLILA